MYIDRVNIESKPGVNIIKGIGAASAFIVDAERVRITKCRFAQFNAGGDIAVEILATASFVMIMENFFLDNDSDVVDQGGTQILISNNIQES